MPKEYVLKKPVIDLNRLKKIAKSCIEEGGSDRQLAIETVEFFRHLVEENPNDDASKKCMTDCMKLAQTAKANLTKIIDLLIKIEDLEERKSNNKKITSSNPTEVNFFRELDNDKEY